MKSNKQFSNYFNNIILKTRKAELLKFVYADNITVSIAWTVYVIENGSNIWFLKDNVWNVLFSGVWRVMHFELSMVSVCDQ